MARRLTASERTTYRQLFPNLGLDRVWVLGEATPRYNCLAWALGRTDAWVWPWGTRNATAAEMTVFLRNQGYQVAFGGPLAVYGPSTIGHAARFTNSWSSKCGRLLLITHGLTEINGGAYGSLRQQYARRATAQPLGEAPDVVTGEPDVEPFGENELAALDERVQAVDGTVRAAFEAALDAWMNTWTFQQVPPTNNERFVELLALGDAIAPLLVDKLRDVDQWPAVYPLEYLLPAGLALVFDLEDSQASLGEQHRARSVALAWVRATL